MMILYIRHLARTPCFDGTEERRCDEWRFQLALTHAAESFADDVARRTTPYSLTNLPPDEEGKKAYLILYWVIVGPLRQIMEKKSRDGREALRKLDAECRSTYGGGQMALPKRIMHPHLNNVGSDAEYIHKLSEW